MNMVNLQFTTLLTAVADPEFPGGGRETEKGFLGSFAENGMKKKEIGQGMWGAGPPLDLPQAWDLQREFWEVKYPPPPNPTGKTNWEHLQKDKAE